MCTDAVLAVGWTDGACLSDRQTRTHTGSLPKILDLVCAGEPAAQAIIRIHDILTAPFNIRLQGKSLRNAVTMTVACGGAGAGAPDVIRKMLCVLLCVFL